MKYFSHRGLVDKNHKENSISAFSSALNQGFKAIEFDIWFLENELVLHHDRPNNLNNLARLQELFAKFQNKIEYWCDFKNLSEANCIDAIKSFKKIVDAEKINYQQLYFAPFITNFKQALKIYEVIRKYFGEDVLIVAVREKLKDEDYSQFYQTLKSNRIYGLSIQYSNLNAEFKKIFSDIKVFAWTVNDQKIAENLNKIGIENIATDKLKPLSLSFRT